MENKIYYKDPYIQTFEGKILDQQRDENGNWYVVLNQTAFYPIGGGQPNDVGTLNDHKVLNVEEINGDIRHYLEEPFSNISELVIGKIDWDRRFDHMQQHAGQHILSAAFEELHDIRTVSFHLGKETSTIDLDISNLSKEVTVEVESLANRIILENRPIETKWVTEEELVDVPLRKELSVTDNIRLVIIPEFDYNGCGGTHPRSTGEVTGIKILGWETQRKKIRLEFVCGKRILKQLHSKHGVISQLSQLLSAPEEDLYDAAKRLLDKNKELEKMVENTKAIVIEQEAMQLLNKAIQPMILQSFENRSIKDLQNMAKLMAEKKEDVVVTLASKNGNQLQFVSASGKASGIDLKKKMTEILSAINGKGGGNAHFFQGGGETSLSVEEFLSKIKQSLM